MALVPVGPAAAGVRAAGDVLGERLVLRHNHVFQGSAGGALASDGEVELRDSVVAYNTAGAGGGISGWTVRLVDTVVRANGASDGGGVYARRGVEAERSTFRANGADGNRGSHVCCGDGGAIYVFSGGVTLRGSTLVANEANGHGGAISASSAVIRDSTLRANTGPGLNGRGGGIFTLEGSVSLLRSTVVANLAGKGANIRAGRSLVARAAVIGRALSGASCWGPGTSTSHGFNVTDRTGSCHLSGGTGDRFGVADLGLGPLADNGGPTMTHLPSGHVLSVIPPGSCPASPDQRGVARPQGPACEAGSVEIH